MKQFFENFEKQDFNQAMNALNQLNKNDQEEVLKRLYYQAREAKMPVAISVLHRKLHNGKTFDDFFNAWMPPKEYTKPFVVGKKMYHQLFEAPVRVINAVNYDDPSDILSVGLVWCTEKEFEDALVEIKASQSNADRRDNISTVAAHVSVNIYKVKSDTGLGT